jgi:predicted RNA binding protein YcfA (HicA-like mRNA interferase family)
VSPKIPRLTAKDLVAALKRLGFFEHHQKGSHLILKHPVKMRRVTIPMHTNKILKLGTLKSILEQADVSIEDIL